MEFFTLLIVLAFLQAWGSGGPLQRDQWFLNFAAYVKPLIPLIWLRVLVLVLIPMLVLWCVLVFVESKIFGLVSLVVYVCVLLFSLGRGDAGENLRRYLSAWDHSNFESAYQQALSIGDFQEKESINDYISLHESVRKAFLYEGFERWFAVVFWFLVLGPIGALGYRLSYLYGRIEDLESEDRSAVLKFVHYLDWVPVRLLVLSFALTGNFVNGFNNLWQKMFDNQPASELLDSSACSAVSASQEPQEYPAEESQFIKFGRLELVSLQSLLTRCVICWLVIIAAITLISG